MQLTSEVQESKRERFADPHKLLRRHRAAAAFGFLLPLHLPGAAGRTLDLAKASFGVLLALLTLSDRFRLGKEAALFTAGLSPLVLAAVVNESMTGMFVAVASLGGAVIGTVFAQRTASREGLLQGYATGVLMSGLVLLLAQQLPVTLQQLSDLGTSGLSYRRTALSYESAVATVLVAGAMIDGRLRLIRGLLAIGALITVVLASGGRGGLVALGGAGLLLAIRAGGGTVLKAGLGTLLAWWLVLPRLGIELKSLDRLLGSAGQTTTARDYTSGRSEVFRASVTDLSDHQLWIGTGSGIVEGTSLTAHNVVLTHLTFGGILGALGAFSVLAVCAYYAWRALALGQRTPEALATLVLCLSGVVSNGPLINPERSLLFATVAAGLFVLETKEEAG